jgi:predicted DNA-binding transcriptional regulator
MRLHKHMIDQNTGMKTGQVAREFDISNSSAYAKLLALEKEGKVGKVTGIENGHATHRWAASRKGLASNGDV